MYHDNDYWKKEFQAAGAEVLFKKNRIDQLYRFLENETKMVMSQLLNGKGDAETDRMRQRALELLDMSEKLVNAVDEYEKVKKSAVEEAKLNFYIKEKIK